MTLPSRNTCAADVTALDFNTPYPRVRDARLRQREMMYQIYVGMRVRVRAKFNSVWATKTMNVGPCHHGMARPQVADGGTASNMERSCE
jgi:hypothetical protein